jgi:hypothetical protein
VTTPTKNAIIIPLKRRRPKNFAAQAESAANVFEQVFDGLRKTAESNLKM